MAATGEHTHHIKIRSTQMEMQSAGADSREEDYDSKLRAAQEDMERLRSQQEALERQKRELEELTSRKRAFISQQAELTEKLTSSLTLIDRGLFEITQEADDLQQCRVCFAAHLDKIQKFNPESWSREVVNDRLEKALMALDIAGDEYDQAATHFQGTRSGAIFGGSSSRTRNGAGRRSSSEFMVNLQNGFAFNLPIVLLGAVALVVYLSK
jgi:chromosome segregation ATPase